MTGDTEQQAPEPTCDTCGLEITTGFMAFFCQHAEQCEFWPRTLDAATQLLTWRHWASEMRRQLAAAQAEIERLKERLEPDDPDSGPPLTAQEYNAALTTQAQEIAALKQRLSQIEKALDESVKLQSHYAGLLNTYDGGERCCFVGWTAWMERLAALAAEPPGGQQEQGHG